KTFFHELVPLEEKEDILKTLSIPWLKTPCEEQLDSLFKEHETLWNQFNYRLKKGTLEHLKYDYQKKEVLLVKPKSTKKKGNDTENTLYDKLPIRNIVDVLRFVNSECNFLSDLTPLQPRYKKQEVDDDYLIAVIIASLPLTFVLLRHKALQMLVFYWV
ncbi:MAG: hypothetical protein WCR08_12905, partial [Gammaproteobacteria bacterium]